MNLVIAMILASGSSDLMCLVLIGRCAFCEGVGLASPGGWATTD